MLVLGAEHAGTLVTRDVLTYMRGGVQGGDAPVDS